MMVISALLSTAQANQLTLESIAKLYTDAVTDATATADASLNTLNAQYLVALRKYYNKLSDTAKTHEDVTELTQIKKEIDDLIAAGTGSLPALKADSSERLTSMRSTYDKARDNISKEAEVELSNLKVKRVDALKKLEKKYLEEGLTDKALEVHNIIPKDVVVNDKQSYKQSAEATSIGFTAKEGAVYARATSKQLIKLVEGETYTFTVKAIFTDGAIDQSDSIPAWRNSDGVGWQPGPEWDLIKQIQESREVTITPGEFGWVNVQVTFKSSVTDKLRFAIGLYKNKQTYFKDFKLTSSTAPTENMFNKDMTAKSAWEDSDDISFAKGVNKAGK